MNIEVVAVKSMIRVPLRLRIRIWRERRRLPKGMAQIIADVEQRVERDFLFGETRA